MSRRLKRISFVALAVLILGGIALYVVVEQVLPYSSIRPHRVTHSDIVDAIHAEPIPEALGMHSEQFNVTVEDSIVLKGWFIHADSSPPLGTVMVLHGIASVRKRVADCKDSRAGRFQLYSL